MDKKVAILYKKALAVKTSKEANKVTKDTLDYMNEMIENNKGESFWDDYVRIIDLAMGNAKFYKQEVREN